MCSRDYTRKSSIRLIGNEFIGVPFMKQNINQK
jgi:hypothetical protein